jgi:SAM-dependent methyltransferase
MAERWEQLAQEDAEFYIWTDLAPGDDFFRSGERDARRIDEAVAPWIAARDRALEIGCGVGRITVAMAPAFGSITAVDIAPTMLAKLEANCRARNVANVSPMLATDAWEKHGPFDLAYSRIVFQHIAEWEGIERYFRRVAASLAPGGVFYVQFDTRPPNILYRIRNRLPDAVLPKTYRRGVRRIRRRPAAIIATAGTAGLSLVSERGRDTLDDEFVFRRTG